MSARHFSSVAILIALALPLVMAHEDYLPLKQEIVYQNGLTYQLQEYIELCSGYNDTPRFNVCMAPFYKHLARTKTAASVLQQVEADLALFPNITDCHFIAHEVGSSNLRQHAYDIAASLADCGDVWLCGGGCHHQIFIDIAQNKSLAELYALSSTACEPRNSSKLPVDFEYVCYHSLGHGFLLASEYNLNQSIVACTKLKKEYAYECLDGIFHQHYFPKLSYDFEIIATHPELLCAQHLRGLARSTCFDRLGKFSLTYYGYHDSRAFAKGHKLCASLPLLDETACLHGLFTFPENCDIGLFSCSYLSIQADILYTVQYLLN